jgi:hypothetical protein
MKKTLPALLLLTAIFLFACSRDENPLPAGDSENPAVLDTVSDDPLDYIWDSTSVVLVKMTGSEVVVSDSTVQLNGKMICITSPGTYSFSGNLSDGQIFVNSTGKGTIRLILESVQIHNSDGPALAIADAKKVVLILPEQSDNYLSDGAIYSGVLVKDDVPTGTIFSMADLCIGGGGALMVTGNYKDGIVSKDGLIIRNSTLSVTAKDDGIRGKDWLLLLATSLGVQAGGDGLKSDNDEDAGKGYMYLYPSRCTIVSAGDAVSAATGITIGGGVFSLTAGGGAGKTVAADGSAKGLKAGSWLHADGGEMNVSSADDAFHSNGTILIGAGEFSLASTDDGVHAESAIETNGGNCTITRCYEGMEAHVITINGGTFHITSSDDGINTGTGAEPGQVNSGASTSFLYVNGGYVYVNANGDGLDINGSIAMKGGTVLVDGPTANDNGALDYDLSFALSGGTVIAAGSSGMSMAPGTNSTVNSLLLNFSSVQAAGTLVHIRNQSGTGIMTFAPAKSFQSINISMPGLVKGTTCQVYTGGQNTGTPADGVFPADGYSPGTLYATFTVSSTVTKIGNGGMPGGPGTRP